jgi:esterase
MKLHFNKTGIGKPLVILHGLFGMSDNWMTLSRQFAEKNYCCYAVDLRNHGRSPHENEFNYQVMTDDLEEFMSNENLSSASFIGHSMGGKAAMFFATTFPAQVDKLIVADISPKYYPPGNERELSALLSVDLNHAESRKDAEAQLRNSLHDEATIQFLLKNLYWNEEISGNDPGKKLAWRFNLSSIKKNIDEIGKALPDDALFNKPVLFIKGERSGYISNDDIGLIKKHFPLARITTIPSAGHWVHAENPAGFMNAALEFLDER